MTDNNRDQQQDNERQDLQRNGDIIGNKSYTGATTTDPDKQRLQSVESNDLDDAGDSNRDADHERRPKDERRSNASNEEDKDIFDQGAVRSAAFSENRPKKGGERTGGNKGNR